ncbi:Uncharacterized protein TCM_009082 [Theobroma cacao]|uniref:CCHC-type domain-containing protein n=1 Tax=Theobroma cacao TaxID=3641 RepID=A0A061E4K5_THECC|nr:Uncharacterized protein TCM_009082 [Theobroma cacao]
MSRFEMPPQTRASLRAAGELDSLKEIDERLQVFTFRGRGRTRIREKRSVQRSSEVDSAWLIEGRSMEARALCESTRKTKTEGQTSQKNTSQEITFGRSSRPDQRDIVQNKGQVSTRFQGSRRNSQFSSHLVVEMFLEQIIVEELSYDACFNCGQSGHMRRDCPYDGRSQGTNRGFVQLVSVVASAVSPPARRGRPDKGKGIAFTSQSRPTESVPLGTSGEGQAKVFAMSPQDVPACNDVVIGGETFGKGKGIALEGY